MSCFDGNIYLRKDYIVCDPDYGVSLTELIERVVSSMTITSNQSTAFSCSLLSSCGIGMLSDVSSNIPSLNNILKWTGSQYEPSTLNLSDLATVSNAADSLNDTTDVGKPLVWGNQGKWVPGIIPKSTSSVNMKVGTPSVYETITIDDSNSNPTPLLIQGSGKISVTYNSDTNTFTITDFTSPAFNGFVTKVDNGNETTRYFGEKLSYVKFTYTDVSAYASGVSVPDGIKLQWKNGSSYDNLATGIAYTNGSATGGQTMTYTLADGSFNDITKTTFGFESFRLEGQSTQAGPFYSAVSNINWITNYYYGYVIASDHNFVINDLTGTVTTGVTRVGTVSGVSKKAYDFSFPSPGGKYIWMAIPTSVLDTSGGSIVDSQFMLGGLSLGFITDTVTGVTSGGTTIDYTIIISSAPQASALTIKFA